MSPLYGPPTTRSLSGAGSPMNDWEVRINSALASGDKAQARGLQEARARINLATRYLEPVFVPTQTAAMMLRLQARAARTGFASEPAAWRIVRDTDPQSGRERVAA